MVTGRIEMNGGRESKLNIGHRKMLYTFQTCRSGVFNPRPTGHLRPLGEFCAAREGYFTKYNMNIEARPRVHKNGTLCHCTVT